MHSADSLSSALIDISTLVAVKRRPGGVAAADQGAVPLLVLCNNTTTATTQQPLSRHCTGRISGGYIRSCVGKMGGLLNLPSAVVVCRLSQRWRQCFWTPWPERCWGWCQSSSWDHMLGHCAGHLTRPCHEHGADTRLISVGSSLCPLCVLSWCCRVSPCSVAAAYWAQCVVTLNTSSSPGPSRHQLPRPPPRPSPLLTDPQHTRPSDRGRWSSLAAVGCWQHHHRRTNNFHRWL